MKKLNSLEDAKKLFKILELSAYVLARSRSEAHRIEETLMKLGSTYEGLTDIRSFSISTAVFISVKYEDVYLSTLVREENTSTDLISIMRVHRFTNKFTKGDITLDQGIQTLKDIESYEYPSLLRPLGSGLTSCFFTAMFGGNILEFISSFIIGYVSYYLLYNYKFSFNAFFSDMFSGLLIGVMAVFAIKIGLGSDIDKIIIGVVMPYVPGFPMVSGIKDVLEGHQVSGMMIIARSTVVAVSMAVGAIIPSRFLL